MATVDYRQAARKAAYLAIVITIIAVLPLINLNPHMDLRVLMVLDAPIFLLMEPTSNWPVWVSRVVGVLAQFMWVWLWTFVVWLIVLRSNRTHGI